MSSRKSKTNRSFTREEIKAYKEAFDEVDKDADGRITLQELVSVMNLLGIKPKHNEIEDMFAESAGNIDFPQFIHMLYKRMKKVDSEQELLEAFRVFDADGNGLIDADEFKMLMMSLEEQFEEGEINEFLKDALKDSTDGKINYTEFIKLMSDS